MARVADLGLGESSDRDLWTLAKSEGRVVMTKDADFAELARQPGAAVSVVWLRVGNVKVGRLVTIVERDHDLIVAGLAEGLRVVEVTVD